VSVSPDQPLDVTAQVTENLRRAIDYGRDLLMLVVSATSCPGCDKLAEQLKDPELRGELAGRAYLVKVTAGDLHTGAARSVRLGGCTLESPGFPTTWVFRTEPNRLALHSVAIGPLDEFRPDQDLGALLDGRSTWVPEAAGARLQACTGGFCLSLDRGNDFSADLEVDLGTA